MPAQAGAHGPFPPGPSTARTAATRRGRLRSGRATDRPPCLSPSVSHRGPLCIASFYVRIGQESWTGSFSSRHPDARLVVLSHREAGPELSISDLWIGGGSDRAWGPEIAASPGVVGVTRVMRMGDGTLYRVSSRTPLVVRFYERLELPLPLPLRIQGGTIEWEVVAPPAEFRKLVRFAREIDPGARVVPLRSPPLRAHLPRLSEAQEALLATAMEAGYFSVPRQITVSGLSRRLHQSPSEVTARISAIEERLLESAVRLTSFRL